MTAHDVGALLALVVPLHKHRRLPRPLDWGAYSRNQAKTSDQRHLELNTVEHSSRSHGTRSRDGRSRPEYRAGRRLRVPRSSIPRTGLDVSLHAIRGEAQRCCDLGLDGRHSRQCSLRRPPTSTRILQVYIPGSRGLYLISTRPPGCINILRICASREIPVIQPWYNRPIGRPVVTSELARRSASLVDRIRRRRVELGLTQQELATRAGIGLDTLRSIEHGKSKNPGVFFVADLARVLNVTVESLTE